MEAGPGGGTVRMEAKTEIKEGEEITVWSPLSLLSFSSLILPCGYFAGSGDKPNTLANDTSSPLSSYYHGNCHKTSVRLEFTLSSGSVLQLRLGNSQKAATVESRMVLLLVFGPSCTKIYL